jgi:hypothetical protein
MGKDSSPGGKDSSPVGKDLSPVEEDPSPEGVRLSPAETLTDLRNMNYLPIFAEKKSERKQI